MIEASYFQKPKLPAPRTPTRLTAVEKGYGQDLNWSPWLAAQVYGIELCWTLAYTAVVTNNGGVAEVSFDAGLPEDQRPGFTSNGGFYSIGIEHRLRLPSGFQGLVLSHPRFYDVMPEGAYNDVPEIIPSLFELDKQPTLLLLVSKLPAPGAEHIYHAGEPFCQIVPVPRGDVVFRPMNEDEQAKYAKVPGGSAPEVPESQPPAP